MHTKKNFFQVKAVDIISSSTLDLLFMLSFLHIKAVDALLIISHRSSLPVFHLTL